MDWSVRWMLAAGRLALQRSRRDELIAKTVVGPVDQAAAHAPLLDRICYHRRRCVQRGVAFGVNDRCSCRPSRRREIRK